MKKKRSNASAGEDCGCGCKGEKKKSGCGGLKKTIDKASAKEEKKKTNGVIHRANDGVHDYYARCSRLNHTRTHKLARKHGHAPSTYRALLSQVYWNGKKISFGTRPVQRQTPALTLSLTHTHTHVLRSQATLRCLTRTIRTNIVRISIQGTTAQKRKTSRKPDTGVSLPSLPRPRARPPNSHHRPLHCSQLVKCGKRVSRRNTHATGAG